MTGWLALAVGVMTACGIYLILRRDLVKLALGVALFGHAANLAIFTAGNVSRGTVPVVPPGESALGEPFADPVPQALVLTAIVISFGMLAFVLALVLRAARTFDTADVDALRETDGPQALERLAVVAASEEKS